MKWVFIILNLAAAVGVIVAGDFICAIHDVHSYSTLVYLQKEGVLRSPPASTSPGSPVDVETILKSIGGLRSNLPVVTYTAAGVFLINALAFFFGWQKTSAPPKPAT